ncbi:MAG: esterase, partial [Bacteroidia bacterium]
MQLNYKVFGSGEPLIILHGLLGSLDNWQTLAKKYAEQYTV